MYTNQNAFNIFCSQSASRFYKRLGFVLVVFCYEMYQLKSKSMNLIKHKKNITFKQNYYEFIFIDKNEVKRYGKIHKYDRKLMIKNNDF